MLVKSSLITKQVLRFTFVRVAESSSEGAAHANISVLQVLQHQVLHWNGLTVHLEALAFVPDHGPRQYQDFSKQEHV